MKDIFYNVKSIFYFAAYAGLPLFKFLLFPPGKPITIMTPECSVLTVYLIAAFFGVISL